VPGSQGDGDCGNQLLSGCGTRQTLQVLISKYIVLENYFMSESLLKVRVGIGLVKGDRIGKELFYNEVCLDQWTSGLSTSTVSRQSWVLPTRQFLDRAGSSPLVNDLYNRGH